MDFFASELVQPTGKYYVPRGKDTMELVSRTIKDANGLIFMAHPFRMPEGKLVDLLDYARKNKLIDGVEVYYSEHTKEQIEFLENYCSKHNLLVSGGSDSHDEKHELAAIPKTAISDLLV